MKTLYLEDATKALYLKTLYLTTCLFLHCKGFCCYFLINGMTLQRKMKKFKTLPLEKFQQHDNGMPHRAQFLQARDIRPEVKKCFYKEQFNLALENFLTTKFGSWVDTCSGTDKSLYDSCKAVEKGGILLQIERATESSDGDLTCHGFILEDAVTRLAISNLSGI